MITYEDLREISQGLREMAEADDVRGELLKLAGWISGLADVTEEAFADLSWFPDMSPVMAYIARINSEIEASK